MVSHEEATPSFAKESIRTDPPQAQTSDLEGQELSYINGDFRSELVKVLHSEMQAMAGRICRDTCREFRRFVDTTAKSRRLDREYDAFRDLILRPPEEGDTFTEFMQRHRLHSTKAFSGQVASKDTTSEGGQGQVQKPQSLEEALKATTSEDCFSRDGSKNGMVAAVVDDAGMGKDHAAGNGHAASTPDLHLLPGEPEMPALQAASCAKNEHDDTSAGEKTAARRGSLASFVDEGFGTGPNNNGAENPLEPQRFTRPGRARHTRVAFVARSGVDDDEIYDDCEEPRWSDPVYVKKQFVKFIKGDVFDYLMGAVLALNAIFMGAQVQVLTESNPDQGLLHTFDSLDWLFACLFLTEVILRVAVTGILFFCEKWNVADIVIVCLHFTELFVKQAAQGGGEGMVDQLGMLRMLRLGRLARMVRMVRLIPELKSMVYLMSASMASFLWAVVLMIVVMYAFAIYFTEICIDIAKERPNERSDINQKWGSIGSSMLTLYMSISGGDDWHVLMTPLTYTQSEFALLNQAIFSMYIAFCTLVMLNLVTGVFVEGAQRIIREEQDNDVLRMASKAFLHADADMSSEITWAEYNSILNSTQMADYCNAVGITLPEAYDLFEILDTDKSQSLSVQEFVKGCLKLRGQCTRMDVAQFRHAIEADVTAVKAEIEDFHVLLQKHVQHMGHALSNHGSLTAGLHHVSEPSNVAEEV